MGWELSWGQLVAGYLGHVDDWRSLEKEWSLILASKGLKSFDMLEFAKRKGPFDAWTETERNEFIHSLLSVIRRWAGVLVAWGIEIDDWQNNSQVVKARTFCALACIATVSVWAKACGYAERIAHFGGRGQPDLSPAFREEDLESYGINNPIIQAKSHIAPLQAAGILAHQTGIARDRRRVGDNLAPYFDELYRTRGHSGILNRELLNWPEDVIRIADLEKSPLWEFGNEPPAELRATVKVGPKNYTLRIPPRLSLMRAEREPKDNKL